MVAQKFAIKTTFWRLQTCKGSQRNAHLFSWKKMHWHKKEWMILKEWAISGIYSVNKKVKDSSKIKPLPYSYPCKVTCIAADESTLLQTYITFYSSKVPSIGSLTRQHKASNSLVFSESNKGKTLLGVKDQILWIWSGKL